MLFVSEMDEWIDEEEEDLDETDEDEPRGLYCLLRGSKKKRRGEAPHSEK